jgi:hypothetical protein
MTEEMGTILRKSLDAVDRSQKWQIAGLVVFLLLMLLHLIVFMAAVHGHNGPAATPRAVGMGVFSLLLTMVACTFGITFFISRMTKRILKAIELSSKS